MRKSETVSWQFLQIFPSHEHGRHVEGSAFLPVTRKQYLISVHRMNNLDLHQPHDLAPCPRSYAKWPFDFARPVIRVRMPFRHGSGSVTFWRSQGRFPDEEADLAPAVIAHLADQISWLLSDILPREATPSALEDEITGWFAARRVVRPGSYRLDRLVRSFRSSHDDAMLAGVYDRLDDGSRARLNALLADDGEGAGYTRLSADPGKPGLDSLLAEVAKLDLVRGLGLSAALLGCAATNRMREQRQSR